MLSTTRFAWRLFARRGACENFFTRELFRIDLVRIFETKGREKKGREKRIYN